MILAQITPIKSINIISVPFSYNLLKKNIHSLIKLRLQSMCCVNKNCVGTFGVGFGFGNFQRFTSTMTTFFMDTM